MATCVVVASCADNAPTAAPESSVSGAIAAASSVAICHRSGPFGVIINVPLSQLASRLSAGDYVAQLFVNHDLNQASDGIHFHRIGDALAAVHTGRLARGELERAACRITIAVAPGVFHVTATDSTSPSLDHVPLVVDVPNITLRGALVMRLDASGRATGEGTTALATTISPIEPLAFDDVTGASLGLIVVNGHPHGSAGNSFQVEGFVFQSNQLAEGDEGGQGITSVRVKNLDIRGNNFEPGFTESIDLRATTAAVEHNHLTGTAGSCDICLAGPGAYLATGNRLLSGGIPGFLIVSAFGLPTPNVAEQYDLPEFSRTWAEVWNNEVQDHSRHPVGVGIRLGAIGVGAPSVKGDLHAKIHDNLLVNNRFGMIFEAAFPDAEGALKGNIEASIYRNTFRGSCEANLLIALTRHTTALGLTDFPWLENSTYRVSLNGNLRMSDVWYGNEAGHGNTLIVDGHTIPAGTRQSYSEDTCPNLGG
ncbi:MAG: hypothetical protein M3Y30_13075 [Gemmatimonadota bacterium]|nr:hypothetical protein [Gemmatimonadota bacterium]